MSTPIAPEEPVADQNAPKLPVLAWLFLFWMAIAAISAFEKTYNLVTAGQLPAGALSLGVGVVLALGVLLLVLRNRRARAYWLSVIAAFIIFSAFALFVPGEHRDLATMTLIVMVGWLIYLGRSRRVRAALEASATDPLSDNRDIDSPAV